MSVASTPSLCESLCGRRGPLDPSTHSSPRKNSAVKKRCSRERADERTPPYNSVSRTVLSAEPESVVWRRSGVRRENVSDANAGQGEYPSTFNPCPSRERRIVKKTVVDNEWEELNVIPVNEH